MSSAEPHSSLYLNDLRDRWWNEDYLNLLASNLDLAHAQTLLDVGCGLGHWGRRWYPRLAPGASYSGIDRESRSVEGARKLFAEKFPEASGRARFIEGDAVALPFADGELDAVTCQTVFIHLAEPERSLAEMVRVLRPGGVVFCAEPNNYYNYIAWFNTTDTRPPEEIACLAEYWARCLRGRKALGAGDETIGARLSVLFADAGLVDINVRQTDRVLHFQPPYGDFERAYLRWLKELRATGAGPWEREKMRRRVRAGGGDDTLVDRAFAILHAWAADDEARVEAGTYSATAGMTHFLVSGRKPGPTAR